jgi:diketogulonate reductase-like aldo/keto reductase
MASIDRRHSLRWMAACGAAGAWPALAQPTGTVPAERLRPIPSSGERIAPVGLGSWITFNVGRDAAACAQCADVMRAFFAAGGRMIDSSPMYGSSQEVIGEGLQRIGQLQRVFAADKVWVAPASRGPGQIEASRALWGVPRFDLLQVHNLLAWEDHLRTLFEMKAAGRLRYLGITTSEGRRLRETEQIMRTHPIDFVQVSYSLADRRVEDRILPLAQERGIAVIANRPFEQGELLRALARHPLPEMATELQCTSWAQFALKFVVSHPAITCAIPATTRVAHVQENVAAGLGAWPDAAQRKRMQSQTEKLV